jgi:hypothetical protein
MPKPRARVAKLTKSGAAIEFKALVDELKFLLDMFPHLRDSYDPDELPVKFILKRDAARSKIKTARGRKQPVPVDRRR